MFKNINKVIDKILTPGQKKEYLIFLEIKENWKKIKNKSLQENAKITDYADKAITIKAKNPAWKNELIFLKEDLKKNFQQAA